MEQVLIRSYAKNGRSTKSFLDEGRFEPVKQAMKPGDFLFIQFGHNDEKADEVRHTDKNTALPNPAGRFPFQFSICFPKKPATV